MSLDTEAELTNYSLRPAELSGLGLASDHDRDNNKLCTGVDPGLLKSRRTKSCARLCQFMVQEVVYHNFIVTTLHDLTQFMVQEVTPCGLA